MREPLFVSLQNSHVATRAAVAPAERRRNRRHGPSALYPDGNSGQLCQRRPNPTYDARRGKPPWRRAECAAGPGGTPHSSRRGFAPRTKRRLSARPVDGRFRCLTVGRRISLGLYKVESRPATPPFGRGGPAPSPPQKIQPAETGGNALRGKRRESAQRSGAPWGGRSKPCEAYRPAYHWGLQLGFPPLGSSTLRGAFAARSLGRKLKHRNWLAARRRRAQHPGC